MKHSVKLLLWLHDTNDAGHHPIYLKITINRQERYLSTGYYIAPKYWDGANELVKPGHLQANVINSDITSRKTSALNIIVQHRMKGETVTAEQVKQRIIANVNSNNIFDFVDQLKKDLKHKREDATLENYRKYSDNLEKFNGSRLLSFEEIDTDFLTRYESWLREQGLKGNYIHAIWTGLRVFFNAAIKRGIINHYPFDQYDNPLYAAPGKEYLTEAELKKLKKHYHVARDLHKQIIAWFLFGCYSSLRISDWYLFSEKNIVGNSLRLRAKKNKEFVSMPIATGLKEALQLIKKHPLLTTEPVINRELKIIAGKADIDKKISSHCARHTFAITMCAEKGISVETCAELMGITVQTAVDNYYKVTGVKIQKECLKAWG